MDRVLLERFFGAIHRQFAYGGVKYAQTKEKEATDCLFDDFGKNWLFGTLAKYCKRFGNLKREKDLFKIACYCFILWLKRGYHLDKDGTDEIINTTVETKTKFFSTFKESFIDYLGTEDFGWAVVYRDKALSNIYNRLYAFGQLTFTEINEVDLYDIFYYCYYIWQTEIPDDQKETDEDVNNEQKQK
jgi:hypothetical protein